MLVAGRAVHSFRYLVLILLIPKLITEKGISTRDLNWVLLMGVTARRADMTRSAMRLGSLSLLGRLLRESLGIPAGCD